MIVPTDGDSRSAVPYVANDSPVHLIQTNEGDK
ncbi:hypothetical protein BH18ACT5_BH18ACT5_01520 [soil metagenome]